MAEQERDHEGEPERRQSGQSAYPEPERRQSAYSDPRYVRDKFAEAWSAISELRELVRQQIQQQIQRDDAQDKRMSRHEELISILTTIVRGNAEIQHGGIVAQLADQNKTLSEVKTTQETAEKERERARERWKWMLAGLGANLFLNLGSLKPTLEWLGQLLGIGP